MTFIVQSTDIITASVGITAAAGDEILILEGVNVVSTNTDGIYGDFGVDNVDLIVAGMVVGQSEAIQLNGDDITVTITETGTAIGTLQNASTGAVNFEGVNGQAINHGSITGLDMYGVFFGGVGSSLNNTGQISGVTGALLWDADSTIVNSGTIMGSAIDRAFDRDFNNDGIAVRGDNSTITNLASGIIGTTKPDGSGVVYTSTFLGSIATVNNAGQIFGGEYGVVNFDTTYATTMDITNSGTIQGGVAAIQGNLGIVNVANSGLIIGDVNLGLGNDTYIGSGTGLTMGVVDGGDGLDKLYGSEAADEFLGGGDEDDLFGMDGNDSLYGGSSLDTISGGAGNDVIDGGSAGDLVFGGSGDDLIDGGTGTDEIFGNSGDDTIDGGSSSDTIYGGSGDDHILGGNQDDTISGGSGDDTLHGENNDDTIFGGSGDDLIDGGNSNDSLVAGSGNDSVYGGSGNDTLKGTLGDDILSGGSGTDVMFGGSDDDTLNGGADQDILSGGWGADVFVFDAISDSATGSATRDTITDFETGLDVIDLSGISGTLTFVSSFTGAAGQVRYNDAVGRLYIDSDGDTFSDFQIDLSAGAGLTADDLIL